MKANQSLETAILGLLMSLKAFQHSLVFFGFLAGINIFSFVDKYHIHNTIFENKHIIDEINHKL